MPTIVQTPRAPRAPGRDVAATRRARRSQHPRKRTWPVVHITLGESHRTIRARRRFCCIRMGSMPATAWRLDRRLHQHKRPRPHAGCGPARGGATRVRHPWPALPSRRERVRHRAGASHAVVDVDARVLCRPRVLRPPAWTVSGCSVRAVPDFQRLRVSDSVSEPTTCRVQTRHGFG